MTGDEDDMHLKELKYSICIKLFKLIPIKKDKIIFWSSGFKAYSCNPKYLTEYILKNCKDKFDVVWVFEKSVDVGSDVPHGVRCVKYFSLRYLYELHTAHFIVCNARTGKGHFWEKRKGQVYFQTWHSSLRLKAIEKDAQETLPKEYIDMAKADSLKIDYILSGCKFSKEIFEKAFWYSGPILETGTPRIDFLINGNKAEDVRRKIGLSELDKCILYAPTFRNDTLYDYELDCKTLTGLCSKNIGGKWKVLYRLHPNLLRVGRQMKIEEDCALDVTAYPDIQELLLIADMVITDYSSCMFDAAYIKKPCFLYVKDYDKYIHKERNLYFDIEKLPFPVAYNMGELLQKIENFDQSDYLEEINSFLSQIGSYEDGRACQRIVNKIEKEI